MQPQPVSTTNKRLERFQAKWAPVRVKKTRQNKKIRDEFDSTQFKKALGRRLRAALLAGVIGVLGFSAPPEFGALAQTPSGSAVGRPSGAAQVAPQAVPGFWDPRRRPDRPDMSRLTVIRFLTEI